MRLSILELIQSKLELFRLEQRYTRGRSRRSTFASDAQYVDGEYIYASTSPYSTKHDTGSSGVSEATTEPVAVKGTKSNRPKSRVGLSRMDWRKGREDKRQGRVSVQEVHWKDSACT